MAEPAGKRELHLFDIARGERDRLPGPGRVDGLAIMPGDVGHVLRRLEAALDLQAGYVQLDQSRNQVVSRKVLGLRRYWVFPRSTGWPSQMISEIDGISAIFDGSQKTRPISSGDRSSGFKRSSNGGVGSVVDGSHRRPGTSSI